MNQWSNRKPALSQQSTQKKKTLDLNELKIWARDMITSYSSADTLFWQVSIDHNMDVQYQRTTLKTKAVCLFQPISWSMAAILGNSAAVVRTRPRTTSLAMLTMRKSIHGFPFLSYTSMGLRLAALRALLAGFWNYWKTLRLGIAEASVAVENIQ